MERAAALESDGSEIKSSRRGALVAAGSFVATGVALAAIFFPLLFNQWVARDDEGVFVFALRELLHHHGSLYSSIWSDFYGPFYYLTMSAVYRLIGQQPSLENGRWIVLILTTASASLFGAAVWRVTKNLACGLLCEVATFVILISVAGNEPMHPGSLGVLLVAVVAFAFSSYAANRRTLHLGVLGAATGALMMTKVNAGGLVAAAVVFGLVVGSRNTRRWMQIVIAVLTCLLPLALVSQNLDESWAAEFAIVVIMSLVGVFVVISVDQLPLRRWPLLPVVAGAAVAMVVSLAFPLLTGTSISEEFDGVFVRPLSLPNSFTVPAVVNLEWFTVVLTLAGICAAVAYQRRSESIRALSGWAHAALAFVALWLLGLGPTMFKGDWVEAKWLPALVVLPALAICCSTSAPVRLALRWLVVLAILQILVVYPVAGSQVGWGTVVMVVPCAIALAAGLDYSEVWRTSRWYMQGGAVAFLCVGMVVATSISPPGIWQDYLDNPKLGLPGTGLMRVDPDTAYTVQQVTQALRANCDTFYGVPNKNSFYIFTGLPAATGIVANGGPDGLTDDQQGEIVKGLQEKASANQRVCILRDTSISVALPPGPVTDILNEYTNVVATAGSYTISTRNGVA